MVLIMIGNRVGHVCRIRRQIRPIYVGLGTNIKKTNDGDRSRSVAIFSRVVVLSINGHGGGDTNLLARA